MREGNVNYTLKLLTHHLEEIGRLGGVMGVLHWDQEVVMPKGATEARASQMSAIAGIIHEKCIDPKIGYWLDILEQDNSLELFDKANIREVRRDYERQIKIPKELVQEMAILKARAHPVWVKARNDDRYQDFSPQLQRWIELKSQWAQHIDPEKSPYDVNIDHYERNEKMEHLDRVFDHLKVELIPLIKTIIESGNDPNDSFLIGNFSLTKQESLGQKISKAMGFDFDRGRLDVSVHPFCGGAHPTDVRITTRYREDDFVESLYAVIHETGHGLYEQGRMEKGRDLPVSEALSMGIHESQSLFWERMIAQGSAFCDHYMALFAEIFPDQLNGVSSWEFYKAINIVRPSMIRVESDELTYPMHVILRYELEKGLFDGSYSTIDLPEIWNAKMEEYLGIRPESDKDGVLQDIHWSMGAFGYFPSYTLGAIYACQFYNALKRDMPDVIEKIQEDSLAKVKSWLNGKIHSQGKLYSINDLMQKVTGEALNPDHFIRYLKEKYSTIYNLSL